MTPHKSAAWRCTNRWGRGKKSRAEPAAVPRQDELARGRLPVYAAGVKRPVDSEARKRRDAAICSQDEQIAEHLAHAYRSGELRSAPSFGKPLAESEGWSDTPVEFRLPFKILKNAGVPPPEVEMFHRRAALREQLAAARSDAERVALATRLSEVEQAIALRLEGMRASGRL